MTTALALRAVRGQPIVVGLRVVSGDPAGVSLTADLKRAVAGGLLPDADAPVVASFQTQFVAAVGDVAAHWLLTIPGLTSASLPRGRYVFDAVLWRDGARILVTRPGSVRLNESISS